MSDILEKIPSILWDLVKEHPIITVLVGLVLFVIYAMASKASPERAQLWAIILIFSWPVSVYFISAIVDTLTAIGISSRTELTVVYARFITHPRLVLSHILVWFVAWVILVAMFFFRGAGWKFREIADRWRDMPGFTSVCIWVICLSILCGLFTSKVHVDLIEAKQTAAEPSKTK